MEKLKEMRPDAIFIHNPYDNYNRVTSVDAQYFSHELKKCTDALVYIPYYVSGEHLGKNIATAPGVINADYVIAQDENIKKQFEDYYPGEVPEGKFLALGSPKFDKVAGKTADDFELPEEWKRKMEGKKVILYNTSIGAVLQHPNQVCSKMRYVFSLFKQRKDVVIWWRPHPLLKATLNSMISGLLEKYEQIEREFLQEDYGIYDDTPDVSRAVVCTDAYYGDESSVADLYRATGKRILYQDMNVLDKVSIETSCVVFDDEVMWFVSREYNALFRYDLKKKKTERMCFLNEEKKNADLDYCKIFKYENVLIITPYLSCKDIIEYDVQRNNLTHINLKNRKDLKGGKSFKRMLQFTTAVQKDDTLYLIGDAYPAIVEYDIKNRKCKYYDSFLGLMDNTWDFSERKFGEAVILGDSIYIACVQSNKVMEFSMTQKICRFHTVGEENMSYLNIKLVGNDLILMPAKAGHAFIKWNIVDGNIIKYARYPEACDFSRCLSGYNGFVDVVPYQNELYFFPDMANKLLRFSFETEMYSVDDHLNHRLLFGKIFNYKWFLFACKYQERIYAGLGGGTLYEILKDETVNEFKMEVDLRDFNRDAEQSRYVEKDSVVEMFMKIEAFVKVIYGKSKLSGLKVGKCIYNWLWNRRYNS